jgi:hypothetical protein
VRIAVLARERLFPALVLTVLILLSTLPSMSMVFVAVSGLAALIAYIATNDVAAGLAIGSLVGVVTMFGLAQLAPELLVATPDKQPSTHRG